MFINPILDDSSPELPKNITYEFAQKEIAQAKGFTTTGALTKGTNIIDFILSASLSRLFQHILIVFA